MFSVQSVSGLVCKSSLHILETLLILYKCHLCWSLCFPDLHGYMTMTVSNSHSVGLKDSCEAQASHVSLEMV